MVHDEKTEKKKKGSYYTSKVSGPETIQLGIEAVYEVTQFSRYAGKEENEEVLHQDKTKVRWIFHMPEVEIKNKLLSYFELRGRFHSKPKIQEDSDTDFMDIADPQKRTEAMMKYVITYIKIDGDERNHKTKLTVKFSKWLDGYTVYIEAYRSAPDLAPEKPYLVATTVNASPEIIKGYWINDQQDNITYKTVGYKDTVYMYLKTLGMSGRVVTTELWEEGLTFMGMTDSNDETVCMNEHIAWRLNKRNSFKKLELPDLNTEDYKKQREGIWESDPLEFYFALPSEKKTTWQGVLTDLKARGVQDILVTVTDNLNGVTQSIKNVSSTAAPQICVVHQIHNSARYVVWKDKKAFTLIPICIQKYHVHFVW